MKQENDRLKEIEEIYLILEQESQEFQELFDALSSENSEDFSFIESENTMIPPGDV